ncbi:ATP-dependent metallopeptidase FtsH/Yme1/Tma family protein [Myxosarcina sp. GI1]|uniref:ATP-dependent metallopeptidase FtsH/Yme1/Tma family protein n=1 Tax=Myxosarcina sp. GI1 TaxID=1541065 RepID=UPI0009DEC7B3|nr:ATP-dependent metallopeptidase FtsH/Yme1/Tma family protein [Myxosarcina sp. GI1]
MPKHQDRPSKSPQARQLGWTLIVTSTILILFSLFLPATSPQSQPYSKFIDLVRADRVERVQIGSNRIEYVLKTQAVGNKTEQVYTTVPVAQDTELPKILRQHQVEFSATPVNGGICHSLRDERSLGTYCF